MAPKIDKAVYISNRKRELNILEAMAKISSDLDDTFDIDYIQSRLEGLEQSWNHFHEADEKVFELGDASEFEAAEKVYYQAKATFKSYIRKHTSTSIVNADDSRLNNTMDEFVSHQKTFLTEFSQIHKGNQEAKLPKANIPTFGGDYVEWASFKDLFVGQIHSNRRLNKATKFQYLKCYLRDRAAKTIEHIPITDDTYDQAWNKLIKRFEKKAHIANSFYQTFMEQPAVTKPSTELLRKLCDTSDEVLRGLTALDASTRNRDSLIIYVLLQKTDAETRRIWAEDNIDVDFPTEDQFLEFLTKRCDALEMAQTPVSVKRNEHFRSLQKVNSHTISTDSADSNVTIKCSKCGSDHRLFKCPIFQAMEVQLRRTFVAENSLCFNCLGKGHSSHKCFSPKRCHKCSNKHHTLLHINAQLIAQNTHIYPNCTNHSRSSPYYATEALDTAQHMNQSIRHDTSLNMPQYRAATKNSQQVNTDSTSTHQLPCTSIDTSLQSTSNPSAIQQSHPLQGKEAITSNHQSSSMVQKQTNSSMNLVQQYSSLLPTAIILVKDNFGCSQPCRVLLDSGSQVTLITESLAQRLQIPRNHARIPITGLAGAGAGYTKGSVQLHMKSRLNNQSTLQCQALILNNLSSHTPEYATTEDDYQHIKHLALADPSFTTSSKVDIILGADKFFEVILPENIKRKGRVIAQNTMFGWIICGNFKINSANQPSISHCISTDIDVLLRRFWEIEEVEALPIPTEEEVLIEKHFAKTHRRNEEGRFIVPLPFKTVKTTLGNSINTAISRLMAMERKFERNHSVQQQYIQFMDEYINLGHMIIIKGTETSSNDESKSCYLPHHAVLKEASGKPKIRVVFDGSAKTTSGISLNNQLLVGPTIQNTLLSSIIKFRKYPIVFAADIEKMYRQILIADTDQDFQRIVWRKHKEEPIQHYRLQTITYGLASSPYQAIRSLKQLGIDHKDEYPSAARIVQNDFYVDDVMTGASTLQQAIESRDQLINMLKKGGFNLRKWKSNNKRFLENIPPDHQEVSPLSLEEPCQVKVLGLRWDPEEDCFSFNVELPDTFTPTKRELLSESSRLFDPLGLLAPSIISIKILFQSLWLLKLQWDDPLPNHIEAQWQRLRCAFSHFRNIKIPRLTIINESNLQIHGFSDASEHAYAAAVYFRSKEITSETYSVRLVAAKTKVAPIKQLSIPRLELCGAVLLTKLIKTVINAMQGLDVEIFGWTDSTIVLQWLASSPRRWKTFIANRTSDIHMTLPHCQWRHIQSNQNPADHASRGVHPSELNELKIWWNGPEFLQFPANTWPTSNVSFRTDEDIEQRSPQVQAFPSRPVNDCELDAINTIILKYSSWQKLLRVFAFIFRFVRNTHPQMKDNRNFSSNISCYEIKSTSITLCKHVQRCAFSEDIKRLQAGLSVSSKSKIISMHPYLDGEGVLRAGGRLQNANIPYSQKHPIILPGDHHITLLIIADTHQHTLHGGTSAMLFYIRRQYWIIGCRSQVKKYIHKCVKCFKLKVKASKQLMGNLPAARVMTAKRAFENVGVDYAGPIMLKTSTLRNAKTYKGYISLFVCMATKAIHLELVTDLTTEAFIAALRRFTARRGYPVTMYSDNGSNFVGADRELKNLALQFESQEHNNQITNHLSTHYTTWKFMCPTASHQGGLYEAGIKSTKYHLRRVIGLTILTYEQYSTVLCQIEAVLNSRPLCSVSDDVNDFNYLSAGHFLIGEPLLTIPEPNLESINVSRLNKWQSIQQITQRFWKAFKNDYLNTLQQRHKWQTIEHNLQIGDLVVVIEKDLPPIQWHIARVIDVHPGKDDIVRVATIKSSHGVFKRPVQKLAKLPIY